MDISDLYKDVGNILFGRYGASHSVDIYQQNYGEIDFHIQFPNPECFKDYMTELIQYQEFINERNLRDSNPVIQRAYDEYKLLLKLSK